jgi:hypothetical protein
MSSTIKIEELQSVEAVAMKYVIQNLGFNIRPRKAEEDPERKLWKVPLQAIVPRRVTRKDKETRVFIYRMEDVGQLLYEEKGNNFELVLSNSALEIEGEISKRFTKLTENIEREILQEGKTNWGKLKWVKTFLNPMYTIVINLLSTQEPISIRTLQDEERLWRYAKLLLKEKYVKLDDATSSYLMPAEKLTMMEENQFRKGVSSHSVAEQVVGNVFANKYQEIKTDLRINTPTVYVDTTKVYYVDALRYGENIFIHEKSLFYEYQKLGARTFSPGISLMNFRTLLSELDSVNMLNKKGKYVGGNERLFTDLLQYREEVLKGSVEAPRDVGVV